MKSEDPNEKYNLNWWKIAGGAYDMHKHFRILEFLSKICHFGDLLDPILVFLHIWSRQLCPVANQLLVVDL